MESFPMTAFEQKLKERYDARPDIQGKLLSPQQMSAYMAWLAQTERTQEELHPIRKNPELAAIVRRAGKFPNDAHTAKVLAENYGTHREERFHLAGSDLSVGRMFRYMPAHWHTNDYFEIYYCFSGCCPIHLENEMIRLRRGSILILAPNVMCASPCYSDDAVLHTYSARSSTFDRVFWNQLPADSLLSSFFRRALGQGKHSAYVQFETGGDAELEQLLQKIEAEYASQENYSGQYCNLLMSQFFLLLFRRYEGTAQLPRTDSFLWKHTFSAIFSYIQTHFAVTTQAEIAATFGYSERQLNRIVKNCTGDTYAHLVLRLKMERAAMLLSRGAEIEQAAEACGYTTLSSFYRCFSTYHGCTPAHYRKRFE